MSRKLVALVLVFIMASGTGAVFGWFTERNHFVDTANQRVVVRNTSIERRSDGQGFELNFRCRNNLIASFDLGTHTQRLSEYTKQDPTLMDTVGEVWPEAMMLTMYAAGYKTSEVKKFIKAGFQKSEVEEQKTIVETTLVVAIGAVSGFAEGFILARQNEPDCDDAAVIAQFGSGGAEIWNHVVAALSLNLEAGLDGRARTITPAAPKLTQEQREKFDSMSLEDSKNLISDNNLSKWRKIAKENNHILTEEQINIIQKNDIIFEINNELLFVISQIFDDNNINDLIDVDDVKTIGTMMRYFIIFEIILMALVSAMIWLGIGIAPWLARVLRAMLDQGAARNQNGR